MTLEARHFSVKNRSFATHMDVGSVDIARALSTICKLLFLSLELTNLKSHTNHYKKHIDNTAKLKEHRGKTYAKLG